VGRARRGGPGQRPGRRPCPTVLSRRGAARYREDNDGGRPSAETSQMRRDTAPHDDQGYENSSTERSQTRTLHYQDSVVVSSRLVNERTADRLDENDEREPPAQPLVFTCGDRSPSSFAAQCDAIGTADFSTGPFQCHDSGGLKFSGQATVVVVAVRLCRSVADAHRREVSAPLGGYVRRPAAGSSATWLISHQEHACAGQSLPRVNFVEQAALRYRPATRPRVFFPASFPRMGRPLQSRPRQRQRSWRQLFRLR